MTNKMPAPNSNTNAWNKIKPSLQTNELILSELPFYTIQGEGKYSGEAAFFIRTSFCSLACNFCDTIGVWDVHKIKLNFNEIYDRLQELNKECKLIIFTGGEPALQLNNSFIDFFTQKGYKINIETSGSIYCPDLKNLNHVCISPKRLSDQSKSKKNIQDKYLVDSANLLFADEIKFIVDSSTNEKMLIDFIQKNNFKKTVQFYVSPTDEYDIEKNKLNKTKLFELVTKYPNLLKISLQIHKILNVE